MRIYDDLGYVIPPCKLCMGELKLGEEMIVTENYFIIHARCNHLNRFGVFDRGEFSEVVGRNFAYFPDFVQQFNEMNVYTKK